jgi:hypothetical protein
MQMELNNMYENIGVNNSSENLRTKQKNTATNILAARRRRWEDDDQLLVNEHF